MAAHRMACGVEHAGLRRGSPVRLARQAAHADVDVEVTLEITPRVPHVFQAYHPILDEAGAALDRAGQFLSAHLAGAARVTV